MKYTGGCHCGNTKYEVEANLDSVIVCNCSHCQMKGMMLAFVPETSFKLLTDKSTLTTYHFNKKVIDHLFCSKCGVQSFGMGKDKDGNGTVAVNVRCLDGVDIDTLNIKKVDGKSW